MQILNYFPASLLLDMQTPPQAPICLWAHNQEKRWHNSLTSTGFPPSERLEVTDLSTQHPKKHGNHKEPLLHFTAPESPALKQRRRQVFSTHYPWESPSWHPFNMGSSLPEWRPQPLGAPDTPLAWQAAPALATTLRSAVTDWLAWRGFGTLVNAFKTFKIMLPRTSWRKWIELKLKSKIRNLRPRWWDWKICQLWIKCDW